MSFQSLGGTSLEDRRARLRNLGALFFGNRTAGTTPTARVDSPIAQGVQQALDPVGELNIEDINQQEGISEYLFQGDIDLTEEQLKQLEGSAPMNARAKRQVAAFALLWPNNQVFYYFDPSINDRKKTLVQKALNYIRARTCIDFIESDAAENRIRVFNGSGCYSAVGMRGGVQDLSLANHCNNVGVTTHEFIHSLGTWHMQMRDDRDDYLRVDLTNVPPDYHGNFVKVDQGESINYNQYEYGSVMHYGAATFSSGSNSLIPLDGHYLRTLGSRVVSFYDIKTINDHYKCHTKCGPGSAVCTNGGEPNPRNCAVCNCPAGYGGALCNQRPGGCGQGLAATTQWQVKQFTFGNASITTIRDEFSMCNHWITAPAGKKIQVRVTFIKNPQQCNNGCQLIFIEPKTRQRVVNPRICCTESLNRISTSSLNPTPVVSYNRYLASTFTFHYRYI
ncbi:astacin [Ancylostoma caninum]|uniref:Zinc metalloproteinase n=1 Tax=Ancylostoma caninum TaxID=29170 RepID=A0A368GVR1_ANCCA|nr:astacin [Ancylostoma caninum]